MEYITTPAQAELNAAAQMRALGYSDAVAVPGGPDGGIDVRSSRAVAQVKWRAGQVGRPEVQRLYGARAHDQHKEMWFFAASGYSKAAVHYADQTGMLLFVYDNLGDLEPINQHAVEKVKTSVHMANGRGASAVESGWLRGLLVTAAYYISKVWRVFRTGLVQQRSVAVIMLVTFVVGLALLIIGGNLLDENRPQGQQNAGTSMSVVGLGLWAICSVCYFKLKRVARAHAGEQA